MKAILVDSATQNLSWSETTDPPLLKDEVLVRVKASAVNRADLLQRAGKYPAPQGASQILGLEAAGFVEKIGSAVSGYQTGQRVFCLLSGGGYAECVAVPADHLMIIPENLEFEQAAAIPEAYMTAFLNLVVEGGLCNGETVLIHAAASGVGAAAVQIARSRGAKVLATAGTKEKCDFVKSLGASDCINYKESEFLSQIGENKVDLVLDMVGQKHFAANIKVLRNRGRLVTLSLISGAKSDIDLGAVLKKNLTLKGSTLRNRNREEKANLTKMFTQEILPLFESGELRPNIYQTFPIEKAQEAHAVLESNKNIGKVVLAIRA
jgi:tumor protein p53-inducible protein 3